jgi:hypothetical protein
MLSKNTKLKSENLSGSADQDSGCEFLDIKKICSIQPFSYSTNIFLQKSRAEVMLFFLVFSLILVPHPELAACYCCTANEEPVRIQSKCLVLISD